MAFNRIVNFLLKEEINNEDITNQKSECKKNCIVFLILVERELKKNLVKFSRFKFLSP